MRHAVLHALGEPTRIAIVEVLARESLSAGDLASRVGISQATLCHHLAILEAIGITESRKTGRIRRCSISKIVQRRQGSIVVRTESVRVTLHPER